METIQDDTLGTLDVAYPLVLHSDQAPRDRPLAQVKGLVMYILTDGVNGDILGLFSSKKIAEMAIDYLAINQHYDKDLIYLDDYEVDSFASGLTVDGMLEEYSITRNQSTTNSTAFIKGVQWATKQTPYDVMKFVNATPSAQKEIARDVLS